MITLTKKIFRNNAAVGMFSVEHSVGPSEFLVFLPSGFLVFLPIFFFFFQASLGVKNGNFNLMIL